MQNQRNSQSIAYLHMSSILVIICHEKMRAKVKFYPEKRTKVKFYTEIPREAQNFQLILTTKLIFLGTTVNFVQS